MRTSPPNIVVVGGSLAGLTFALACATRGIPVRVFERSAERVHGGDSLSVDLVMLEVATGHDPRAHPVLPVVRAYRDRHLTTWPALYGWLRARVIETAGIRLEEGREVTSVEAFGEEVQLAFSDGTQETVDAVVGADGYHSTVRREINLDAPFARYAGYLVWRGLVEESALSNPVLWPSNGGLWIELVKGYRLVAAVLPGRDGSMVPGQRQVTFAWFDANQDELLRKTDCLTVEGNIVQTVRREKITPEIRSELASLVPTLWPAMWQEAVTMGVQSIDALSGAPIAEYSPHQLTAGRLTLIGDAAHVLSPMTGSGYFTGMEDAIVLAKALGQLEEKGDVRLAFAQYESARLPYIKALVAHSQLLSNEFERYAKGK